MHIKRTAFALAVVGAAGGAAAFSTSPLAGGLNSLGRRLSVAAKGMVRAPGAPVRARCCRRVS
jgi:hypothetical protein